MKIKNLVAVFIVSFMLVSCVPAVKVVPTETAIPVSPPTITSVPQNWVDSVQAFEGELDPVQKIEGKGWVIDGVIFDPAKLVSFPKDDQPNGDKEPRFGLDEKGQVQLRCYGEVTLPNSKTVLTGFLWFQKLGEPNTRRSFWEGINYLLGSGLLLSLNEPDEFYCANTISKLLSEKNFDKSFSLIFNPPPTNPVTERDKLLKPLITELAPPFEFWQSGDIALLPKVDGKPFLFATHFMFNRNK